MFKVHLTFEVEHEDYDAAVAHVETVRFENRLFQCIHAKVINSEGDVLIEDEL